MIRIPALFIFIALACGACSKKSDSGPSAKTEPAPAAPSPAKTEPAPAPSGGGGEIDLSPGGAAWKGFTAKGPEAKVADDGAGGISVAMKDFQLSMTQGDLHIPDMKAGIKFGLETSKGKATYTTDKPDEIEYMTETPNADGAMMKGYGFAMYTTASGKKIGCSASLDDAAQVAAAKAVCQSVTKK